MANEFDIDALLDQALGNIHPDANKGNDDKSVSENETLSTLSNVEAEPPVSNLNNDLHPGESRQSSDRASTKSKLQELRTEIANASKSFNFDDTLNAAFSEKGDPQPNSDRVFDIGYSQGSVISNGQSPDFKNIDAPKPAVQEDWTSNFNPEDIVNNFNQPKPAVQTLNGSQDAFVSNNGNQSNFSNGSTAGIISAPDLRAVSDNGSKAELKHESIESALDNVLGVSENSVLQAENSTQDNVAIVSGDVDIDKLLAAEFDDDFPASFASAPPPPPAVSAPPPPPPVVSPPPPPPVIAPQEVRPPINLPHPQPAIPKYVAEEGVLATPPPITGSEVSLSDGVDDMLNGLLDDMKSGQNRQQNRRDAVMSEFNSMAATSKASTPPPAPANSNIRPPKKTYAFPKQNTTDSQQLSEQPAIEDDSQDNQPLIGMQPIIIKKGTVKKLKRK